MTKFKSLVKLRRFNEESYNKSSYPVGIHMMRHAGDITTNPRLSHLSRFTQDQTDPRQHIRPWLLTWSEWKDAYLQSKIFNEKPDESERGYRIRM